MRRKWVSVFGCGLERIVMGLYIRRRKGTVPDGYVLLYKLGIGNEACSTERNKEFWVPIDRRFYEGNTKGSFPC